MRFLDKIALITGGAQGIGLAVAQAFAQEGATVIIWDVQHEKAQEVVANIEKQGGKAFTQKGVDITSLASTELFAKEIHEKYGKIDIIVNNAGIVRDASFLKMTEEQWHQVINVNLTGTFNCTKAVIPYMTAQNYGRIINISSVSGLFGNFGQTNYVAAKAGVSAMVKVWGKELGKFNVTANAIAPGPIATDMLATVPNEVLTQMQMRVPVRRLGEGKDIANAVLFLADEKSGFVTGQTLCVDGGFTLGG